MWYGRGHAGESHSRYHGQQWFKNREYLKLPTIREESVVCPVRNSVQQSARSGGSWFSSQRWANLLKFSNGSQHTQNKIQIPATAYIIHGPALPTTLPSSPTASPLVPCTPATQASAPSPHCARPAPLFASWSTPHAPMLTPESLSYCAQASI